MAFTKSIWNQFSSGHSFSTLSGNITADVALIGGGITGISTAHLLAQKGFNVVVLESLKVGGGTTSHSTGNLYFTIDKNLGHLRDKYDAEVVRKVIASRSAALNLMEKWVEEFNIDCNFKRQPWYLYSALKENDHLIEKEFQQAKEAGVAVSRAPSEDFPLDITDALVVKDQVQFNPMRYVQEFAQAVASDKCQIFENTRVKEVEEKADKVILTTTAGIVTAKFAVHATHTPKGIKVVQTLLGPYREYGIACRAEGSNFPEGIFWGFHEEGKKYSSRLYERDGQQFVMVIGEMHKVGQSDNNLESIAGLKAFAKKHFGLTDVVYRWGGQHYKPADLLPYIGREFKGARNFIATGFSTDGLVYGVLAAMIIADDIAGEENEWAEMYSAYRFQPIKSAKKFMKENLSVAKEYFKLLPGISDTHDFDHVKNGSGAIVEKSGHKIAAYRDGTGKLHLVSAVCPHLKCIVNWNNAEQTWDCPCHASRFEPDGTVLEGPSYEPLQKMKRKDNKVEKV